MKNLKQWINWIIRKNPDPNQKDLKVPFCVAGQMDVNAHAPNNWLTYQEVKATGHHIGFVLTSKDPYFCVDLDACLVNGEWSRHAYDILDLFPGAYVEVSYSQNGLHIFGSSSEIPEHGKKVKTATGEIELYSDKRFIAFTEQGCIGDYNIDLTSNLQQFISDNMSSESGSNPTPVQFSDKWQQPDPESNPIKDDNELIEKMLSSTGSVIASLNGKPHFRDLWENDASVLGKRYPDPKQGRAYDHSSADMALMHHLAFWTGRDLPRMLRLARMSKLVRKKWERSDYLERTACTACSQLKKVYGSKKHLADTEICEEPLPDIIHAHSIPIRRIPDTQDEKTKYSNYDAALMILLYKYIGRIQRINNMIRWWSGREWEEMYEDDLKRFVAKSVPWREPYGNYKYYMDTYKTLLILLPRSKTIEPCKRVFFRNGVLDLITNQFEPHNKDNLNLGTIPVAHCDDPNIDGIDEWDKFLISMFGSLDDDRVVFLQEIFGWMTITHNLGIEKYIALSGATRAGKGVVLRVLKEVLGSVFCGPINFSTFGTPQGHAALWRFNVVVDTEAKMPKKDERIQALDTLQKVTSNETLSSRRLYRNDNLEGVVNCKLIVACNKVPMFSDDSGASASRVATLVFSKSFLGKEDIHIFDRLREELPGITKWSLKGLRRLIANNGIFTIPDSTEKAMEDLGTISKPLSEFIEEHIIFDPDSRCFNEDLYKTFQLYREQTGTVNISRTIFIRAMKETLLAKNIEWKKIVIGTGNKRGVIGIRIVNPLCIPISAPSAPVPASVG